MTNRNKGVPPQDLWEFKLLPDHDECTNTRQGDTENDTGGFFSLSLLSWLKTVNAKFYDRTSGGSGGAGGGVPNLMEKVREYNRRKKFGQHWYRQTLICDGGDKIMT